MINLDKSLWTKVKLSDVVTKREENDKQEARNRFDRFLKVEHLDAESLHVKRWASQEAGDELPPTFYKIFRKGQVLFPTRNPHLRRTALASFDGICGEKTLTLEPNSQLVNPEFLPFLFHCEKFYAHTTSAIVGSTNPHVRWRDVANFEFLLPPMNIQLEILELFKTIDSQLEFEYEVLEKLVIAEQSFCKDNFYRYRKGIEEIIPQGYTVKRLEELADISGGSTPSRNKPEFWEGNIPWLTPTDVTRHDGIHLANTKEYITELGLKNISNRIYPPGTILYCSRATIGVAVINDVEMATNQGFSNFICNGVVSNYFLYFLLQHVTPDLTRLAGGSTFLEISKSAMRSFKVIIPDEKSLTSIERKLLFFDKTSRDASNKIDNSKQLKSSLINKVF